MFVPAAALFFFAATQVSLAPDRPEAEVGELDLAVDGERWTSEPIEVDATAVALTWVGDGPSFAAVRVSEDGEIWGPWTAIHDSDDHGPDPDSSEMTSQVEGISEAVYVGDGTGWLQFRVHGEPHEVGVAYVDTTGGDRSLSERLRDLIERVRFAQDAPAAASPLAPAVMPRSAWGGDQCRAGNGGDPVEYHAGVELMFVHHTVHSADSNAYTADDVANLLYAICSFHVEVRGWTDIAYNALVDKYGRIWEGRAGGIDQSVIGAHTGGFNSYSTGVAFIGDYRQAIPSAEAESAFIDFASWKLDVHHVDPRSTFQIESLGSSRWAQGELVDLRGLSGHRDASSTACPGDGLQYRLDGWAQAIATTGGPKIYVDWPRDVTIAGSEVAGYTTTFFPFHLSEEMSWTAVISDENGVEVLRETGSGSEGTVTWSGTAGELNLPDGHYTIHLEALPLSGAPAPLPASFGITLGDFTPPFSDDEGSVHEEDIGLIASLVIAKGCAPDRFCPHDDLRRWQMALFLTRMHVAAGFMLTGGEDQGFTDTVALPAEYQIAINQLAQLGVTKGTSPTTFAPEGVVTREQMALFLIRWAELAGIPMPDGADMGFTDIAGLSAESQTAINRLAQLGITTGTDPAVYSPANLVTREQMASFLARTLRSVPGLELGTEPPMYLVDEDLPASL